MKNIKSYRVIALFAVFIVMIVALIVNKNKATTRTDVVAVMEEVNQLFKDSSNNKDVVALHEKSKELLKVAQRIKDGELRKRTMESVALIDMIYLAWQEQEDEALGLFGTRLQANEGGMIYPEAFEESLAYAKFTMLNLFFKRFDMKGAYLFTSAYPVVSGTKHDQYFTNLDRFILGDMDGAEAEFKSMLAKDPDNKMIQNTISYIQRVRAKGITPQKSDEVKVRLEDK